MSRIAYIVPIVSIGLLVVSTYLMYLWVCYE